MEIKTSEEIYLEDCRFGNVKQNREWAAVDELLKYMKDAKDFGYDCIFIKTLEEQLTQK